MIYALTALIFVLFLLSMNLFLDNKKLKKYNTDMENTCRKFLDDDQKCYLENINLKKRILELEKITSYHKNKFKIIVSDSNFEIYSANNACVAVSRIYKYKCYVLKVAESLSKSSGWEIVTANIKKGK